MTAARPQFLDDESPTATRGRGIRFLVAGAVLIALGAAAFALADAATVATGWVLGSVVAAGGVAVVVQALRDKGQRGFSWQLLFGSVEIVGGLLIIMNPIKGAAAITLLVVIVLIAQAVTQAGLAVSIRPARGWWWPIVASLLTLLCAAGLLLRFPYALADTPGEVAGIAMVVAGLGFLLMGGGWLGLETESAQ
ncbi:DUF308 domain-containing protein [Alsobacter sp. SYSU M60028]|uniref:DUF308 domain-containing protein n=1 Tax=Alsobacter ponti TaxID=2962936 RepID=A0ABT1LAZ2_9HYPH|nr:DUF308 domain-containing protein [Alsobacter ponti]MCP8938233.1 DUF308 domain-containing protein [Alsobacter ponti]